MKYLILFIFLIQFTFAKDIYHDIIKINSNINKEYAKELARIIRKKSNQYKIDKHLLVAIFAQESMFNQYAINCNKKCTDYGIGQIHHTNIKRLSLDPNKLLHDLDYSIETSTKILIYFKKVYKNKEMAWWTRYNANHPKLRKKYRKLVCRYYSGKKYCK